MDNKKAKKAELAQSVAHHKHLKRIMSAEKYRAYCSKHGVRLVGEKLKSISK